MSESDKLGFKLKCLGFLPALVVLLPSGDAGQGRGARGVGELGWEGEGMGKSGIGKRHACLDSRILPVF